MHLSCIPIKLYKHLYPSLFHRESESAIGSNFDVEKDHSMNIIFLNTIAKRHILSEYISICNSSLTEGKAVCVETAVWSLSLSLYLLHTYPF